MAGLRAKKPELEANRFRALMYGNRGCGKTHFACSIPSVYYIDTEGVLKFKRFVDMLKQNKSDAVYLPDLTEVISEVKKLLTVKHDYKTLVIDSLTFPYAMLGNMEAERLIAASGKPIEGTEFGANLAKPKRLIFHLAMLLTRLDMNVICLAHEKTKYENGVELGKIPDIHDKMEYALGTVIHLRKQGKARKAFVEKSRYDEMAQDELLDFDQGYNTIRAKFGEEVFVREAVAEVLATPEQLAELKRLIELLKIPDDVSNRWKTSANATSFEEMNTKHIQVCIDKLFERVNSKTKGE